MVTSDPVHDYLLKYKILKAVEDQCRPKFPDGHVGDPMDGREGIELSVDGLSSSEISDCCARLGELGLIKVVEFHETSGDYVYPISLTRAGADFLSETDRDLRECLKDYAIDLIKSLTKIDLNHPAFAILGLAFKKYLQNRSVSTCSEQ